MEPTVKAVEPVVETTAATVAVELVIESAAAAAVEPVVESTADGVGATAFVAVVDGIVQPATANDTARRRTRGRAVFTA
ncbi:MAG: hypothetical protein GX113_02915 [Actinobacteria bacterium]|nr:hypothetical protein [Actinomycetota bacterium]